MKNKGEKRKVLFYSGHCEIVGGDAKYLFELVNKLNCNRYDVKITTDRNPVFADRANQYLDRDVAIEYLDTKPILFKKPFIEILREKTDMHKDSNSVAGILSTVLAYRIFGYNVYHALKYLCLKLGRVLSFGGLRDLLFNVRIFHKLFRENRDIDIFHFNNGGYPGKAAGLVAVFMSRFYGVKKTVMSVHNLPGRKEWYRISDHIADMVVSRCCKKIIIASDNLKKEMVIRRNISESRIITIFCGLDDADVLTAEQVIAKKKEIGLNAGVPVLSMTSNLDEERKGHSALFKAMVDVKRRYPVVKLLVIGDGIKKRELIKLSENSGLKDNIIFLGYREDITDLNGIVDIVIVPSIGFEAVPYSIREAMRAVKPVITTDAGGCAEAVEDGINGLVVPQADPGALARAILKLLDDRALCSRMGRAGRDIFENKFLMHDKILEHENVYGR
jgi:glycosyltransferase involved in cell wall biosynthesis